MLRKRSKDVPEDNDPTPLDAYLMITREESRRILRSESMGEAFGEFKEDLRRIEQRVEALSTTLDSHVLPWR